MWQTAMDVCEFKNALWTWNVLFFFRLSLLSFEANSRNSGKNRLEIDVKVMLAIHPGFNPGGGSSSRLRCQAFICGKNNSGTFDSYRFGVSLYGKTNLTVSAGSLKTHFISLQLNSILPNSIFSLSYWDSLPTCVSNNNHYALEVFTPPQLQYICISHPEVYWIGSVSLPPVKVSLASEAGVWPEGEYCIFIFRSASLDPKGSHWGNNAPVK